MTDTTSSKPEWSARCDCRNGHNSNSGRCNERDVTDPTSAPGKVVFCSACRSKCRGRKE